MSPFSGIVSGTALVGEYTTARGDTGRWAGSWMADGPTFSEAVSTEASSTDSVFPADLPDRVWIGPVGHGATEASLTAAEAGGASPSSPIVGTNVLASSTLSSISNEPSIAINRALDANNLVLGYIGNFTQTRVILAHSVDGGVTWSANGIVPGLNYTFSGDPSVEFDSGNRAFCSGIATDGGLCQGGPNARNALFITRSTHKATTFQNAVVPPQFSNTQGGGAEDKPSLTVDNVAGSSYFGLREQVGLADRAARGVARDIAAEQSRTPLLRGWCRMHSPASMPRSFDGRRKKSRTMR